MIIKNTLNRVVGRVEGDTFHKTVTYSKHFFRNFAGYGIDTDVLKRLDGAGVKSVEIRDTEIGEAYKVSLTMFLDKGIKVDYGFNEQRVLPVKYFHVRPIGQKELF